MIYGESLEETLIARCCVTEKLTKYAKDQQGTMNFSELESMRLARRMKGKLRNTCAIFVGATFFSLIVYGNMF